MKWKTQRHTRVNSARDGGSEPSIKVKYSASSRRAANGSMIVSGSLRQRRRITVLCDCFRRANIIGRPNVTSLSAVSLSLLTLRADQIPVLKDGSTNSYERAEYNCSQTHKSTSSQQQTTNDQQTHSPDLTNWSPTKQTPNSDLPAANPSSATHAPRKPVRSENVRHDPVFGSFLFNELIPAQLLFCNLSRRL